MPDTKKTRVEGIGNVEHPETLRPPPDSLLNICSRNVAEFMPFQYIEEKYQCRIPGRYYNYKDIIVRLNIIWQYYQKNSQ